MIALLRDLQTAAAKALPDDMSAKAQPKQSVPIQTPSGVTGTATTEVTGDSPSVTRTYERTLHLPDGRQSVQRWSGTFRYDFRSEDATVTETLPDGRQRSITRASSTSAPSGTSTATGSLTLSDGQRFVPGASSQSLANAQQVHESWQRQDDGLTVRLLLVTPDKPYVVQAFQGDHPADTLDLPTVETGVIR